MKRRKTNYKLAIPLIILALIGLFFMGRGITGLVVSQSCCFPPDCEPENMCSAAQLESPADFYESQAGMYFGAMIVLASGLVYVILRRKHKQERRLVLLSG